MALKRLLMVEERACIQDSSFDTHRSRLFIFSCAVAFLLLTSGLTTRADAASDFTADVQTALRAGAQSSTATRVQMQEYKTSWDEFGTSVLVDGASAPEEIQKGLIDDIVRSLQTELLYNQKDEHYLQLQHSSPEEILNLEGDGGNDLSPENYIQPNPSLKDNPEVNPSTPDVSGSTIDAAASAAASDATASETDLQAPDTLTPADGEWKPTDLGVFETIVNTDAATDATTEPAASPDAAPPPSSDVPAN